MKRVDVGLSRAESEKPNVNSPTNQEEHNGSSYVNPPFGTNRIPTSTLTSVRSVYRSQPCWRSRLCSAINAESDDTGQRDTGCTQGHHRPPRRAGEPLDASPVSADPDDQLSIATRGRSHRSDAISVHDMVSGIDAGPARGHNPVR